MTLQRRRLLQWAAAATALPFGPRFAHAQAYPAHPVRLFVGFPAGGQIDIIARVAAQALSDRLGQSVVVENKPGAGGRLAPEYVTQQPADGDPVAMVPGLFLAAVMNSATVFAGNDGWTSSTSGMRLIGAIAVVSRTKL